MDKTEMLIVRACAKPRVNTALRNIYQRFYLPNSGKEEHHINIILTDIVDSYCSVTAGELLNRLAENSPNFYGKNYNEKVRNFLIGKIATTPKSAFPREMIWPKCA